MATVGKDSVHSWRFTAMQAAYVHRFQAETERKRATRHVRSLGIFAVSACSDPLT